MVNQTTIQLPEDVKNRLFLVSSIANRKMSYREIIEELLDYYLNGHKKKK